MIRMKKQVAIGVILFNATDKTIARIVESISLGFMVYLFDNSPGNPSARNFFKNEQGVRYITCGKNLGLGFGLSSVCAHAYYDDYPALLFFDQDTAFTSETLEFIEEFYMGHKGLALNHSAVVFNSSKRKGNQSGCFTEVSLARNSGTMFFLENLKKIDWHNERYFIDGVDYEFCLRSLIHEFKISEFSCTPGFDHTTEQEDEEYSFFGMKLLMRKYSLKRIGDVIKSSLKIVLSSIFHGRISFMLKIIKLLSIYIVAQFLVRFISTTNDKNSI